MDDDERAENHPTKLIEEMKWRRDTSPGERGTYIYTRKMPFRTMRKQKKGNPIFTAPRSASDQLDAKREGGERGQGDKKIHNEGFSEREKNVKRYSYRKVKCSPPF